MDRKGEQRHLNLHCQLLHYLLLHYRTAGFTSGEALRHDVAYPDLKISDKREKSSRGP